MARLLAFAAGVAIGLGALAVLATIHRDGMI